MSTRSYICMEVGDNQYKTIYCHFDGYLDYNGAMLVDHYSDRATVEKLLELGDLSALKERLEPDPSKPHGFDYDKQQEDVCIFYSRDRGDKDVQAKILSLRQLDDPDNWTEYVYIYTKDNQWKYFETGHARLGLRDVKEDLQALQAAEQQPITQVLT